MWTVTQGLLEMLTINIFMYTVISVSNFGLQ